MGDPKFPRARWSRPSRPFQADRIQAENELMGQFGLRSKREVWKTESLLRHWRQRARVLQAQVRAGDAQAEKEVEELLQRLARLGILASSGAHLDDVLTLQVRNVLARRLQTVVYLKGLASTPRQARQFIVHRHVAIGPRKVTIPGYLVRRDEEDSVQYHPYSDLANEAHPSRPSWEVIEARRLAQERRE
ncbi:MAG: 30S ribosomal protein S4 [Thermoplasmata archaeon]